MNEAHHLDKRIAQLPSLDVPSQYVMGLSIILDSPNGEAPYVFSSIRPEAAVMLGKRVDSKSGLMTPDYFKRRVNERALVADATFDNSHRIMPVSYVLLSAQDVSTVKALLKTVGNTQIVGSVDGLVAAVLHRTADEVSDVVKGAGVFGVSRQLYGDRFDDLHKSAVKDLLANMRAEIARSLNDSAIESYLKLKDTYKL